MIYIEKAEWENFLSFQGKHSYTFQQSGMHFIQGINKDSEKLDGYDGTQMTNMYSIGSGKTTFTQLCMWALYGEITKNLNKDDVINKHTKLNCSVKIWFNKDNIEFYRVERYRKHSEHRHNVLLFKKVGDDDWEDISYEDNDETQEYINKITNLNEVTFRRVTIFHRDDSQHFMDLNNAKRSALFENITAQFESLQKYFQAVKKYRKRIAQKIQDQTLLLVKEKTITEQNVKLIKDAKSFFNVKTKELKSQIDEIQEQINDLLSIVETENLDILKDKIAQFYDLKKGISDTQISLGQCDINIDAVNDKMQNLDKSIQFTMKTIKSKEDEIKNLNKMICDKCGHVLKISEEHEIKLKEELQENNLHLTELMLLKDSHKDELKHLKEAEKLLKAKIKDFEKAEDKLNINENLRQILNDENSIDILQTIDSHKRQIELLKQEFVTYKKNLKLTIKKVLADIEINKNNIAAIKNKLNLLHEKESFADFWNEKLNIREENSIKQFLMLTIIPVFNFLLQKILDYVYHGDLTITFDSYFNETIIKNGQEYKYHELSTGEKLKLNLCISLAIFDLTKINMSGCSILFIDEILTNIDEPTIKTFLNLFAEKYALKSAVYVISHQDNVKNNIDPKTITYITKEFEKSTLKILTKDGEIEDELR